VIDLRAVCAQAAPHTEGGAILIEDLIEKTRRLMRKLKLTPVQRGLWLF
jgi:hypothetical protein